MLRCIWECIEHHADKRDVCKCLSQAKPLKAAIDRIERRVSKGRGKKDLDDEELQRQSQRRDHNVDVWNPYLLNVILLVLSAVEGHDGQCTAKNPHDRNGGFGRAYDDRISIRGNRIPGRRYTYWASQQPSPSRRPAQRAKPKR